LITPICPHTLTNRSIVISSRSQVEIRLVSQNIETIVSADGLVQTCLRPDEPLIVKRSRRALHLVRPNGGSFFETVRQKLHWRGSNI
jgi:NAD+ kinase